MKLSYPVRFIICLVCIIKLAVVNGQSFEVQPKLSPVLLKKFRSDNLESKSLYRIAVKGTPLILPKIKIEKLATYDSTSFYIIRASYREMVDSILPLKELIFVESGERRPKEELRVGNIDLTTNNIGIVHRKFPGLTGEGMTVSIKEDMFDSTDIDFAGRYLATPLSSVALSTHASTITTMIAGGGNSWYTGKGVAWGARITSADFVNTLPESSADYKKYDISVQNHSYGVDIENYYGADAAMYDASSIANPSLMHIFSSGNSGTSSSSTGKYTSIPGFANLTGSFKMAKNILTVGATDAYQNVSALSSRGPAYDGRIKPEIVAFGIDGSSGAAALVSGASLLLQQQYKIKYSVLPPNALVKAILLNSADDKGNKYIDYINGYGSLNLLEAVKTLNEGNFLKGTSNDRKTVSFILDIPANLKMAKMTLVWNDPPSAPNSVKALVNDLDLKLTNLKTMESWEPWILNSYPNRDSLKVLAKRGRDSLNNIEQITIDSPLPGLYRIDVLASGATFSNQDFYLAYQFDTLDIFEWDHPTNVMPLASSSAVNLRWESTFNGNSGVLESSFDNGRSWQIIDSSISLEVGNYTWNVPLVTTAAAILRMKVGSHIFSTDTLVITSQPQLKVGFSCLDSALVYWNSQVSVKKYNIYKMGTRYLEKIYDSEDSSLIVQTKNNLSTSYAVAPFIDNREGVRSFAVNYNTQGSNCYIESFGFKKEDTTAYFELRLGSLYNINKIILEKKDKYNFYAIEELPINGNNLVLTSSKHRLTQGANIYRVKMQATNGKSIYSQEQEIFLFEKYNYILYPNPVVSNTNVYVSRQTTGPVNIKVFNTAGIMVLQKSDMASKISIPTSGLKKGLHIVYIYQDGLMIEAHKLIIL